MRKTLAVIAWIGLGVVIGGLATAVVARRLAAAWDRSSLYMDELRNAATSARVLAALDAKRESEVRSLLERELESSLEMADQLATEGAIVMIPLGAGTVLDGIAAAEAYAGVHRLDAEVGARAARLRDRLCAQLSPGSKYRGSCR